MAITFELTIMDETGEATLPYAVVELTYRVLVGKGNEKQRKQAVTDIHGKVRVVVETGGKSIEWKLACEDPRYFCAVKTTKAGQSFDGIHHKITMHCDSFIAVMDANNKVDVLRRFKRAVDAAREFALESGEVLLLRNHVVNHHEYDTNQIYGGLIGRRVTAAYEKIAKNRKDPYDTLYNPFVLYKTEEAKRKYVTDLVEKKRQGLQKNRGMAEQQKLVLLKEWEDKAEEDMKHLKRLIEPTLKEFTEFVAKEFKRGVEEVEVLRGKALKASKEDDKDGLRQLLQDAQESGAKSPFISTVLFEDEDLPEAVDSVCQYTVDRFKDGLNLELMLLAGPKAKGLDFETCFELLDEDGTFEATAHRSEEKRKKDAELKEFGIWNPSLPLDGTPDPDGFRILKRCVLKLRD